MCMSPPDLVTHHKSMNRDTIDTAYDALSTGKYELDFWQHIQGELVWLKECHISRTKLGTGKFPSHARHHKANDNALPVKRLAFWA